MIKFSDTQCTRRCLLEIIHKQLIVRFEFDPEISNVQYNFEISIIFDALWSQHDGMLIVFMMYQFANNHTNTFAIAMTIQYAIHVISTC